MPYHVLRSVVAVGLLLVVVPRAAAQGALSTYVEEHYTRSDHQIPMRDGVKLYTIVYAPKDQSQKYPMLMLRTPYGIHPYEKGNMRSSLGPSDHFLREGYIFVYQDVRGRYLSEGEFENMRPHKPVKKSRFDIDESSDTYDTIDWLIHNIPNHNGKVGLWGISYPGFYASAGMIDAHPNLKAVSPQAPIADWFFDDFFHHGAFFLPHAFNFFNGFGQERPKPTPNRKPGLIQHGTNDGYRFFLEIGPLSNVNPRYFKNRIAFWNEFVKHPNYDDFWRARNILPHLQNVAPAVMTVGGWFDAEDLYGPLQTYRTVERQNPGVFNILVMGPWRHGGWNRTSGDRLGNIHFGAKTAEHYQKEIEFAFFNHFLKGKGKLDLPEATVFETGANRWRRFDAWPPPVEKRKLYFHPKGKLAFAPPDARRGAYDEYVSDPAKPVPFTEEIAIGMTTRYMTDDQRFASRRPDVLVYQTEPLPEDVTLAGRSLARLYVSTSGTDSDWVVKLIDVFPDDAKDFPDIKMTRPLAGYQMLVRSEVIRGRFRNSYSKPEPFVPNEPTLVKLPLQDVLHTFKKGHRIMIQVHSTWFPLVDRNPQKFVPNIFLAEEGDFIRATQRVYRTAEQPSHVEVGVLTK